MKNNNSNIDVLIDKIISEEIDKKIAEVNTEVTKPEEIDEMEEFYEIAKRNKEDRKKKTTYDEDGKGKKPTADKERKKPKWMKPNFKGLGDDEEDDAIQETKKTKTLKLTEDELIGLIEKVVKEEKLKINKSQKDAHTTSKKDSDEFIRAVDEKMSEYLKTGSKSKYDANPKDFPKGNHQHKKAEEHKYIPSDGVEEYIEQIARSGGMENLSYDQIKPDEEWLDKNIVGSSETGNNPEWANAVETDANKGVKKRKDLDILNKLKRKSYNRAEQPVIDYTGRKGDSKKMAGIDVSESEKTQKQITEDVKKIKDLFTYKYGSQ
jgi:hypothetical protein